MNAQTKTFNGTNGAVLRIALVYMITGFAVFLLMGLLGLLMRLDHAGIFVLPPQWFYRIMTLHGTGMIAAVMLAAMGGIIAIVSASVPLSPRMLWTIYIIYFLGAGFVILATLVGGFAAGWTILHPLPYEPKGQWSLWAALAMFVGTLFVAVAFLLYCFQMLYATSRVHGGVRKALAWEFLFSGGRRGGNSLPRPAELVATVVAIDGIIAVLAGALYLIPLFALAAGVVQSVNVLLAKNFLFLFGHTFANLNIYLSAALVYTTLPLYTGRPLKTSWPMVLALNLVIILVLMPYFHHLYQDFVQPLPLHIIGQIGSYGVGVPAFLVTIIGGLGLMYRSGMRWSVPSILMALGLWGWTFGGIGAVLDSTIAVNQVMHNTLWVPAHFHSYYLMGAAGFAWAYLYHLVAELAEAQESGLSRAAAWLYGIGGAGFLLMFFLSGANSVPRRYAAHLPQWQIFARVAVPFVIILGIGVGWLALEVLMRLGPAWQRTQATA